MHLNVYLRSQIQKIIGTPKVLLVHKGQQLRNLSKLIRYKVERKTKRYSRFDHLYLQWKFKLWVGKFVWGVKAKHCWALSTNFWKQKVCWQHSLKVKGIGSNPGYLLKSFLLYVATCLVYYFHSNLFVFKLCHPF